MDPKDQSPWNYQEWLISLISPIQVVAMRYLNLIDGDSTKAAIVIGLSHRVKNFSSFEIDLVDGQGNQIPFSIVSSSER